MADLTIGAFFFAMRSCEYSSVKERGRTKLLTVANVKFYSKLKTEIPHNHPNLQSEAEYVTITFEDQKNNKKMETRTQQRTGDSVLCPVLAWARVIRRIINNPDTSPATTVNFFHDPSAPSGLQGRLIHQDNTRILLRATADILGKTKVGYTSVEIGTHSLRSGAAMALFLANESVHKIMILGRWSSDAFLAYIRPQVMEWVSGMSKSMIQTENFFHAPDSHSAPAHQHERDKAHSDDPRIPGDPRSFAGSRTAISFFNGPNAASFLLPRLHLFH